ncbi:flagellar motor stator protein MotA [Aquibacillus albus]|uniref:Chemotaxis protein MotA n=1 Tax=Aquibacillus albus TaxID=1168171 RepID=A0ABS2N6L1_9BACI|nr:flagellar motor stator protein MotA [Aquibacillus albus]MBM7573525.1 chemotaxis protein MotA [Aquibacillus albus]
MDKTTVIGIIVGVLAIGVGMVLKGVNVLALVNPAALIIIFLGTLAAVFISFPMNTIKNIPQLIKIIFKESNESDLKTIITMFTNLSDVVRKEGVLALETHMSEFTDTFLKSGIGLIVDGQKPEFIRDVLLEKIDAMEQRHQKGIRLFTQAGTFAPTLGVLGAVVGLIAALGHMEDVALLGKAISAAFIATLFGIFSGYVLWHPFANKLREKSKDEVQVKLVMIEGILSVANGESPLVIKDKLGSYLSTKEFDQWKLEQEEEMNA